MELSPINPADFVELHKQLGLALWHIQAFEDCLCKHIVLILRLPPSRAEEEMLAVLHEMESKTLGGLIAELRKGNSTNSVSEFERRVNRFLAERNWLVHKSWSQHHMDLFTPERLPPLLGRIAALATEAHALQDFFTRLTTGWVIRQGFTQEQIEEGTREFLRQRGVMK